MLCLLAGSTTVVVLLVLLAGERVAELVGLGRGWLLTATLASAGHFAVQVRLVLWQARGMAVQYGSLQLLQTTVKLGLSLLLVLALDPGWAGRAAGISAAAVLYRSYQHRAAVAAPRGRHPPKRRLRARSLRFGAPLDPHVIGSVAIANSDRLVVAGIAGLHEAGVCAAGMQWGCSWL